MCIRSAQTRVDCGGALGWTWSSSGSFLLFLFRYGHYGQQDEGAQRTTLNGSILELAYKIPTNSARGSIALGGGDSCGNGYRLGKVQDGMGWRAPSRRSPPDLVIVHSEGALVYWIWEYGDMDRSSNILAPSSYIQGHLVLKDTGNAKPGLVYCKLLQIPTHIVMPPLLFQRSHMPTQVYLFSLCPLTNVVLWQGQ